MTWTAAGRERARLARSTRAWWRKTLERQERGLPQHPLPKAGRRPTRELSAVKQILEDCERGYTIPGKRWQTELNAYAFTHYRRLFHEVHALWLLDSGVTAEAALDHVHRPPVDISDIL